LEREWAALNTQAQEEAEQRTQAEQEIRERRTRLEQLKRALDEARAEAARLNGERAALERMRAAGAAYDAGVQALLQANLAGVVGPLGTLVQAPPEWERAIEAALGPDLQAVVIERAAIATEVQRLLESTGGRVTLLPLDGLRPAPPLPAGALCAASIATCDERLRPAVEATLGAVALCSDLAAARTLLSTMPPGSRCVTADGIVLRAEGALSVGGIATGGLLASERAHRELPARVEEAQRRCQEIEGEQQTEAAQIAALEAQVEELARRAAAAREKAARFERETLGQARMEAAVAGEALRSQQAALQREQALLERLQAQESARRQRVQELETDQAAVATRIQELRAQFAQMDAQLRQVNARIQPAEEELARLGDEQVTLEAQEQRARSRAKTS
jgi:chromosome segregation protein